MATATTGGRMAEAQLAALDDQGVLGKGLRAEILNGELVIRGVPRTRHERAVSALLYHFVAWTREHGGDAFAGSGIEVSGQRLIPDVAFLGSQRRGELDEDGFHVPPDLVVEVTSPGSRSLDLHEKREIYESIGVPEYWVVDLRDGRVLVHRRGDGGAFTVTEPRTRLESPMAPGLAIPVSELVGRPPS